MASDLQEQYNAFRNNIEVLNQKAFQLETDIDQHVKVLSVLQKTDPERATKYMVNNVLIDIPVKDAISRVENMRSGIEKALESIKLDLVAQEKSLEEWKVKHKVKVVT